MFEAARDGDDLLFYHSKLSIRKLFIDEENNRIKEKCILGS